MRQKRYAEAYRAFDQSAQLAREASEQVLAAQVLVATVRVAAKDQDTQELQARYGPATSQVEKLPDTHDKAYLLLALGRLAEAANWGRRAHEAFDAALAVSSRGKDRRAESKPSPQRCVPCAVSLKPSVTVI